MQPRIEISIPRQELRLYDGDTLLADWPVSTARAGTGSEPGSLRTPTGRFRICEKIGDGAPEGAVFRSRIPTGEFHGPPEEDLVQTRILWLDGLEPHNANTRDRYIYIHGTNHEDDIGKPSSHGCIRMRNRDVIALFDRVEPDTPVEILE